MVSRRIQLIASLLDKSDIALDVGTDHALLPIYLKKHNMVSKIDASDVSSKVLETAINNVKIAGYENDIDLYLSDGVKSVDVLKYNTLIICGMGFHTIKDILSNAELSSVSKMIIQTNNNYDLMRKFILSIGYMIYKEFWICENGIDYLIFLIHKGKQKLSDDEINCGIYNEENKNYYKKEVKKLEDLISEIPALLINKRNYIQNIIDVYKSYISR